MRGRPVACERTDTDRYGRAVAICTVAGADLGRRVIEAPARLLEPPKRR